MNAQEAYLPSRRALVTGLAMLWLIAITSVTVRAAQFIPLGGAPSHTHLGGLSDDGQVVFGQSNDLLFRWTDATGMQLLSSSYAQPADASADGSVAVGVGAGGWLWTEEEGLHPLVVTKKNKTIETAPNGISADGSIVVGGKTSGRNGEAFRWSEQSGLVTLPMFPGHDTASAYDVSADGRIVVGLGWRNRPSGSPRIPLCWIGNSVPSAIPSPTGFEWNVAQADSVSPDGTVVTGWNAITNDNTIGFRWTIGTAEPEIIGWTLAGTSPQLTVPRDVSAAGEIIVGFEQVGAVREARIWDAGHGARDLQVVLEEEYDLGTELSGWVLRVATKVSPDGQNIAGYGTNPLGNTEGFLVRLGAPPDAVPEPQAVVLLLAGSILLSVKAPRGDPNKAQGRAT